MFGQICRKPRTGASENFCRIPVFPRNSCAKSALPNQFSEKVQIFREAGDKFGKCSFSAFLRRRIHNRYAAPMITQNHQNPIFVAFSLAADGWSTPNPHKIDTSVLEERAPNKNRILLLSPLEQNFATNLAPAKIRQCHEKWHQTPQFYSAKMRWTPN